MESAGFQLETALFLSELSYPHMYGCPTVGYRRVNERERAGTFCAVPETPAGGRLAKLAVDQRKGSSDFQGSNFETSSVCPVCSKHPFIWGPIPGCIASCAGGGSKKGVSDLSADESELVLPPDPPLAARTHLRLPGSHPSQ